MGTKKITGNLTIADGRLSTPILTSAGDKIEALKPVVEVMNGYRFSNSVAIENITLDFLYVGAVKNGNKLTIAVFGEITKTGTPNPGFINAGITLYIPQSVDEKLTPSTIGGVSAALSDKQLLLIGQTYTSYITLPVILQLYGHNGTTPYFNLCIYSLNDLELNTKYTFRYEETFLLSENLIA